MKKCTSSQRKMNRTHAESEKMQEKKTQWSVPSSKEASVFSVGLTLCAGIFRPWY